MQEFVRRPSRNLLRGASPATAIQISLAQRWSSGGHHMCI